jgi:hypothetical protein
VAVLRPHTPAERLLQMMAAHKAWVDEELADQQAPIQIEDDPRQSGPHGAAVPHHGELGLEHHPERLPLRAAAPHRLMTGTRTYAPSGIVGQPVRGVGDVPPYLMARILE